MSRRSAWQSKASSRVKAIYSPADMAKPSEIAGLIALGEATFGAVDILVNNAASSTSLQSKSFRSRNGMRSSPSIYPPHSMQSVRLCRHEEAWLGRIITTASAHSRVASPFKSAYVAAKHGIAGLTKTVALELARSKITCNCISPGYVWTPLVERQIPNTMMHAR
jgi:3-hydroxybutyrate dehydrogenase